MDLAIETIGLTRRFGNVSAVDGISLQVERGTFYGFLGPNGAGKSTTIKMLTGLLAPSAGHATVADFDVVQSPLEVKRRIGVVPENLALFDNLFFNPERYDLSAVGRLKLNFKLGLKVTNQYRFGNWRAIE